MAQLLDIRSSDMGPRDFLVKWADGEEDSWVRPASWSPSLDAFSAAVKAGMHEALALLTRPSLPPTTPQLLQLMTRPSVLLGRVAAPQSARASWPVDCCMCMSVNVPSILFPLLRTHLVVAGVAKTGCLQVREIDVAPDLIHDWDNDMEYAEAEAIERERIFNTEQQFLVR